MEFLRYWGPHKRDLLTPEGYASALAEYIQKQTHELSQLGPKRQRGVVTIIDSRIINPRKCPISRHLPLLFPTPVTPSQPTECSGSGDESQRREREKREEKREEKRNDNGDEEGFGLIKVEPYFPPESKMARYLEHRDDGTVPPHPKYLSLSVSVSVSVSLCLSFLIITTP